MPISNLSLQLHQLITSENKVIQKYAFLILKEFNRIEKEKLKTEPKNWLYARYDTHEVIKKSPSSVYIEHRGTLESCFEYLCQKYQNMPIIEVYELLGYKIYKISSL